MAEDNKTDPASQEQSVEAEGRPDWLPERFKDPEALASSYAELEKKLREQGEERNNLEAQLSDLYARQQEMEQNAQQAQYNPGADPLLLAYEQAMETGDYKAALAIQVGLAQQVAQQNQPKPAAPSERDYETWAYVAEQTAAQQVGAEEWAQYKDRVAEEAAQENFDNLSAAQAASKLVRIHRMIKAEDTLKNQPTAEQQAAEVERLAKLQAQTMTGSSGRMPAPTKDEAAVDAILQAAREGTYDSLIS